VACIPIPGGRSLRPVKNKGGGSFDKVVNQNFPLFFTPPIFQSALLTKNLHQYFLLPPYFSMGKLHH